MCAGVYLICMNAVEGLYVNYFLKECVGERGWMSACHIYSAICSPYCLSIHDNNHSLIICVCVWGGVQYSVLYGQNKPQVTVDLQN